MLGDFVSSNVDRFEWLDETVKLFYLFDHVIHKSYETTEILRVINNGHRVSQNHGPHRYDDGMQGLMALPR